MAASGTIENMSTTESAPLIRAHKTRLAPTASQRQCLAQNCGYARKAYNAALAHSQQHAEEEKKKPEQERRYLSAYDLDKWWTEAKKTVCVDKEEQPWYQQCNQVAAKNAIVHGLGPAYANWRRSGWNPEHAPTFHKKGRHDSYRASNGRNTVKVVGKRIRTQPTFGRRMREPLRFTGAVLIVTVSRMADWWYVSITVETTDLPAPPNGGPTAGVDVGLKSLAVVVSGAAGQVQEFANLRPLQRRLRQLRRVDKAVARSRNVHGLKRPSNRREKRYRRRARLHARVAFARQDMLHKATTAIAKQHGLVGAESLHVKGLLRNKKLARHIADVGWGEFLRQLGYKAQWYGSEVVEADQWYPSTQTCSACGVKRGKGGQGEKVTLAERTFVCYACGFTCDRDENAALNLQAWAEAAVDLGGRETKNGRGGDVSPLGSAVFCAAQGQCTSEASTPSGAGSPQSAGDSQTLTG